MHYKKLLPCVLLSLVSLQQKIVGYSVPYVSQCGQDKVLNECFFRKKKQGVFVDIGAHDGISGSNSYFFEKELGWTGICFEPMPNAFEKLKENRSCICVNACVAAQEDIVPFVWVKSAGGVDMLSGILATYDPRHWARMQDECSQQGGSYEVINMDAVRLETILQKHGIKEIDYLSVDTEGNELEILQSINFDAIKISAISVENNYREPYIENFLKTKGFVKAVVFMGFDELYIHKSRLRDFHKPTL